MNIRNEFFLITIIVLLFFINFQNSSAFILFKKISFLMFCFLIYAKFLIRIDSWKKLILPTLIALISLLNFFVTLEQYFILDGLILISIYFIQYKDFKIEDSSWLKFFEVITVVSILLNLISFRFNGRSTIGGIDPNFSSLLIFLFLAYLIKMGRSKVLISICLLAGFMTLSRSYLVAVILLMFFMLIKNRKVLLSFFLVLPFLFLFSLHFFTYRNLFYNFRTLYNVSEFLYFSSGEHTNPLRMLHLVGNTSDNIRSEANIKTFVKMRKDSKFLIYGSNPEKFEQLNGFKMAHNFYLFQISQSGIFFGILAILMLYFILIKNFYDINCYILLGFCSYISFLGIEVGSIYIVFLVMILKLKSEIRIFPRGTQGFA